jgi:hypothetical protein
MIRHTATNALLLNALEEDDKTAAANARKAFVFVEDGDSRTSIAALVKIACNASNSESLRATACDCLGDRIAGSPDLAAFAARELFARRKAGAPAPYVFDALLEVIREAPSTDSVLFRDAIDALCEERADARAAAVGRFMRTLKRRRLPSPAVVAAINIPAYMAEDASRHA